MPDYSAESDEKLLARFRNGERQATDFIMDKYKKLVKKKAGTMYLLGADREDLIQEGMIGLFKAMRDYNENRQASFYTYAYLCISRQMYSAVQASNRKKHIPLNTYISFYGQVDSGRSESGRPSNETTLENTLVSSKERNPEEEIIDRENVALLKEIINTRLSPFEKRVLDLYLTGMGYSEIAGLLGTEEKSTDNALQRSRSKIRKALRTKGGIIGGKSS